MVERQRHLIAQNELNGVQFSIKTTACSGLHLAAPDIKGDEFSLFWRAAPVNDFIPRGCMTHIIQSELPLGGPEKRHVLIDGLIFAKHIVCRDKALLLGGSPVFNPHALITAIVPPGNITCRIDINMTGLQVAVYPYRLVLCIQ